MELHIDARSAKCHAFHAQAESLFGSAFSGKFDGAAGADHAVPGQSRGLAQQADDLARGSRPACGPGNRAVAGYFSLGQRADGAQDASVMVGRRFPDLVPRARLIRCSSCRHFLRKQIGAQGLTTRDSRVNGFPHLNERHDKLAVLT